MMKRGRKGIIVILGMTMTMLVWMSVIQWQQTPLMLAPPAASRPFTLPRKEPARGGVMLLEGYGSATLTFRMFCALESAAKNHPDHPVYLIMTSPVVEDTHLLQYLRAVHRNLHLVHLNAGRLFKDSPLEAWYARGAWKESKWPYSHYSDALRWLLLWRYGGIYLDLDVVVTQPLTRLGNCTGLESGKWVAAGVLKFSPGHPVILSCLEYFAAHFDGQVWGANGPELLTQVLQDRCGLELPSGRTPKCPDVSVMVPRAFYPVPWWEWKRYVTDDPELSRELLADPQVMVLHVWNLHTRYTSVRLSSHQPYARAAHVHCPLTATHAGNAM